MRQAVTVAAVAVTVRSMFARFLEHVDASGRYWKNGQGTTQRQM
jgi:hypothetical protein